MDEVFVNSTGIIPVVRNHNHLPLPPDHMMHLRDVSVCVFFWRVSEIIPYSRRFSSRYDPVVRGVTIGAINGQNRRNGSPQRAEDGAGGQYGRRHPKRRQITTRQSLNARTFQRFNAWSYSIINALMQREGLKAFWYGHDSSLLTYEYFDFDWKWCRSNLFMIFVVFCATSLIRILLGKSVETF